ncbi:hypothetical protein ACF058_27620 [Streptomyces sp. NPDC015501]|uniref:hypothetical protein n=1 Tax=unclassified Streptomyces TaxID=2593676 RepID=UPI001275D76E|nr:hypothetical protein A3L22_28955 [Streptomyces griseus subsp. griseus]
MQELLDWATAHPAAAVRSHAARITADLGELTERRNTEAAQAKPKRKSRGPRPNWNGRRRNCGS